MNLHRGVVDVGVLGALELDRHGNINTTLLEEDGKVRYFNGSAGGNDLASLARRVLIIMRHERRKLRAAVAHITSPGFVDGKTREQLALRGGGPHRVITDKGVIEFGAETRSARLMSLHPGTSLADLLANTEMPLEVPEDVPATPLPSGEELRLLREEIDPRGVYLGKFS
jgi:glutaconate CoA-transferase subunit B